MRRPTVYQTGETPLENAALALELHPLLGHRLLEIVHVEHAELVFGHRLLQVATGRLQILVRRHCVEHVHSS